MNILRSLPGIIAAALVAGASAAALAADSGDRTSMPNSCSERDANCVIQDGAPRRRGGTTDGTAGTTTTDSKGNPIKAGDSTKPKSGADSTSR